MPQQQGVGAVLSLDNNENDNDDSPQALPTYPALYRGAEPGPRPMDNYYIYHNQVEQFKTDLKRALMRLVREYLRLEEERRKQSTTVTSRPSIDDHRLHNEEIESEDDESDDYSEDLYSDVLSATTTSITN